MNGGDYGCGAFFFFQNAFDTGDHNVFLIKPEHYDIRWISNKWFSSYHFNRKQFVSINRSEFNLTDIKFIVLQVSILGSLLYLIHINGLYFQTKYCQIHLLKKLKINRLGSKNSPNWQNDNKYVFNGSKTELEMLNPPK